MMDNQLRSFAPIRRVVTMLLECHGRVGLLCRDAGSAMGDSEQSLMLMALARQQRELVELMTSSRRAADDKILTTRVQFVPDEWVERTLATLTERSHRARELSSLVLALQNQIVELLHVVQDESASEDVHSFLQAIADWELTTAKRASLVILGMRDV